MLYVIAIRQLHILTQSSPPHQKIPLACKQLAYPPAIQRTSTPPPTNQWRRYRLLHHIPPTPGCHLLLHPQIHPYRTGRRGHHRFRFSATLASAGDTRCRQADPPLSLHHCPQPLPESPETYPTQVRKRSGSYAPTPYRRRKFPRADRCTDAGNRRSHSATSAADGTYIHTRLFRRKE